MTDGVASRVDADADRAGTPLPRWVRAPAAAGAPDLVVPVPPEAGRLAAALDVPGRTLVLAALVRTVAMLANETSVLLGYRDAGRPVVPLTVEVGEGSWRDLVHATRRAEAAAHRPGLSGSDGHTGRWEVGFGEVPGSALAVAASGHEPLLRYDPGCVDAGAAGRVRGYLTRALAAMAADPDAAHLSDDLLDPAERRHLVHERGGPARRLPDRRVHEIIAERARERPDAVAIVHEGKVWSYDRLNRSANRIAHALAAAGLRAEEVVGVAAERGPLWAAAILGVFKAGGAYLAIEPSYPAGRVATLVERSGCRILLTDAGGLPAAAGLPGVRALPVGDVLAGGHPDAEPAVEVGPRALAYVYFTSGSTGLPKGAMCEHLGMLNHLFAKIDDFGIGPDDVVVQATQASFDISLWQLVAALMVGGRTLIVSRDDVGNAGRFLSTLVAGGATVLQVVPSYLDVLLHHVEQHPRELAGLRLVCVTGEAIGMPLVRRWFAAFPGVPLVNAYGATEASDDTNHEIMTAPPADELVPVGRPLNNVTIYVLGPHDTLRPLGGFGEVVFSGVCVSRGYLNDPDRTAEAFAADPFRPGERMYRSGDVGRWLPGGSIEFGGRRDEQVKIHGVRLELGEVESRIREHPGVRAASVLVAPLAGEGRSLVGFYTTPDGLAPDQLREHLGGVLPASAVPARLYRLDTLPLTENGKVDKRRLAVLAQEREHAAAGRAAAARVPPRTPTQVRIARAWALALDRPIEQVGARDNFFETGGGSLSALRMVASLDGLISLNDLIRHPVLDELAAAVDRQAAG